MHRERYYDDVAKRSFLGSPKAVVVVVVVVVAVVVVVVVVVADSHPI